MCAPQGVGGDAAFALGQALGLLLGSRRGGGRRQCDEASGADGLRGWLGLDGSPGSREEAAGDSEEVVSNTMGLSRPARTAASAGARRAASAVQAGGRRRWEEVAEGEGEEEGADGEDDAGSGGDGSGGGAGGGLSGGSPGEMEVDVRAESSGDEAGGEAEHAPAMPLHKRRRSSAGEDVQGVAEGGE